MRIPILLGVLVLAGATLPVAAQSLKPGLWEINNKVSGNPQMDQAMAEMQRQLAAMPPEQRKQMESMMAQSGIRMVPGASAGGGMAIQMCVTREMAERNEVPMQEGCKVERQQRSGNQVKFAVSCTKPPSSGDGTFTFTSPEAYSSQMTVKTVVQGRNETMNMDSNGKWLSADCGSVRPPGTPAR